MGPHSSKQYLLADKTHFWQDVLPGIITHDDVTQTTTCDATNGETVTTSGIFWIIPLALSILLGQF